MNLTKSEYLLYLKHPAWLWLKKYDKAKLPTVDANTQAVFDAGNKLELYARQLFNDGILLGFTNYQEYQSLSHRTQQALKDGNKTLFQARFDAGNLTCLTDVVVFTSPNTVHLYEIKSSTKVKPEHEHDLAFQTLVLEGCGFEVETISVIHVDNTYVRQGEINPEALLKTVNVTEKVRSRLHETQAGIEQAFAVIASREIPDISPRHCGLGSLPEWLPIFRNLRELPRQSIYDLCTPSTSLLMELEDQEILLIKDIPDSIALTEKQANQVAVVKAQSHQKDIGKIKEFLSTIKFPIYFFDYETCSDVIPPYDGVKPYQQVPCQYSLHILDEPGGDLRHKEFIHRTQDHPAEHLAKALRNDIGDTGSIAVWYAKFETGRNKELAELLPEYSEFFHDLNDRVVDLMTPFSEGWFVDSDFMGSASIKKVLPVLVPELSYKELAVQEGQTAQRLWMEAVLEGKGTSIDNERLFTDLLAYCELDTLAMVKIYEHLLKSCSAVSAALNTQETVS